MIHKLKCWPKFFNRLIDATKNFEVRINDRNFSVGDELLIEEFIPEGYYEEKNLDETYTGRFVHRKITYIFDLEEIGMEKNYVIMSVEKL